MHFGICCSRAFALALCFIGLAGSGFSAIIGQWDFENGNLAATIGAPLQFRADTGGLIQFGTTTALGARPALPSPP